MPVYEFQCTDENCGLQEPVIAGLDAYTGLNGNTICPNLANITSSSAYAQGTTVYGRLTCVDQLNNLLTKYYPCAKGWNRWKILPAGVAF